MTARLTAAAFTLLLFAPVRSASPCDSSSCSLVTRGQNGLVPKGDFRLDLSYRYTDDAVPLEGSTEVERVYRPKVAIELGRIWPAFHREVAGHESFLQLDGAYGVARRTTLLLSIPILADRSYGIAHGGPVTDYGTTGMGDVLVGVRQGIWRGIVGGFSVKLPNGKHRIDGDFDGSILDPTLQPGTGSWDFVTSLQYGGRAPWRMDWTVAANYQATTTNDLGYRFGNLALGAASLGRSVAGPLSASLQLKFVHEGRHTFLGEGVRSTGSDMLYLTPALSLRLPDRSALYALVQLVPYRYVNETQLAPRVAFLLGASKTF